MQHYLLKSTIFYQFCVNIQKFDFKLNYYGLYVFCSIFCCPKYDIMDIFTVEWLYFGSNKALISSSKGWKKKWHVLWRNGSLNDT